MEPDLSVLLFEREGWGDDDYLAWSNHNSRGGIALCLPTKWEGRSVLRLVFINPNTQLSRVRSLLESLVHWVP